MGQPVGCLHVDQFSISSAPPLSVLQRLAGHPFQALSGMQLGWQRTSLTRQLSAESRGFSTNDPDVPSTQALTNNLDHTIIHPK